MTSSEPEYVQLDKRYRAVDVDPKAAKFPKRLSDEPHLWRSAKIPPYAPEYARDGDMWHQPAPSKPWHIRLRMALHI